MTGAPTTLGDMHHAVVALHELGGSASPSDVAEKLRWFAPPGDATTLRWADDRYPDRQRAKTALLAAADRGLCDPP